MTAALHLIGLSGPPRSGKDTVGGLLAKRLEADGVAVEVLALSTPMRLACYAFLGWDYSPEHYHEAKDRPFQLPDGRETTLRQEMIALSEKHVKPRMGHGWWGQSLLNKVNPETQVVIVTDMGFDAEHDLFVDRLGAARCEWFHLYRGKLDFSGDSRKYIGNGSAISNNSTPDAAAARAHADLVAFTNWNIG